MPYISVLLLVAAATSDSFVVGFNYGVKSTKISAVANTIIACLCYLGTLAAMLLGKLFTGILSDCVTCFAGGSVLVILGVHMLVQALDNRQNTKERLSECPEEVDLDGDKIIDPHESLIIGVLLSLNNIGLGVGAGISGFPIWITPPACAVFSFLFIWLGHLTGKHIQNKKLSHILEVSSALLITLIGAFELLICAV